MQSQYDEAINALRIYHDIPQIIAEEWAEIRGCESQRDTIPVLAVQRAQGDAKPGSGTYSDTTAGIATSDRAELFQKEIDDRLATIDELRREREWIRLALEKVERKDREILELAYMGPVDQQKRLGWRPKTWKQIAEKVDYSDRHVRRRAYEVLGQIMKERKK